MTFATTPTIGVNLDGTFETVSDSGMQPLGTIVQGTNGSLWMACQASTSVSQYYAVGIDEDYKANPLTSTMAAAGYVVGWAQAAVAATDTPYFWAALQGRGNINIAVAASCAADVALYTTATAGILDDAAATGQTLISGAVIVTTQASTTGLAGTEAIVTYARGL